MKTRQTPFSGFFHAFVLAQVVVNSAQLRTLPYCAQQDVVHLLAVLEQVQLCDMTIRSCLCHMNFAVVSAPITRSLGGKKTGQPSRISPCSMSSPSTMPNHGYSGMFVGI